MQLFDVLHMLGEALEVFMSEEGVAIRGDATAGRRVHYAVERHTQQVGVDNLACARLASCVADAERAKFLVALFDIM